MTEQNRFMLTENDPVAGGGGRWGTGGKGDDDTQVLGLGVQHRGQGEQTWVTRMVTDGSFTCHSRKKNREEGVGAGLGRPQNIPITFYFFKKSENKTSVNTCTGRSEHV